MSAKIRIDYFGVEGEGRTVAEAKLDAGQKIKASLAGDYTPTIIRYRDVAALVYREPSGWHSRLIETVDHKHDGPQYGSFEGTFKQAVASAAFNVSQLSWHAEDGENLPPVCPQSRRAELLSWVRFQLAYREGRARGLSDQDAHDYAGNNPARRVELPAA